MRCRGYQPTYDVPLTPQFGVRDLGLGDGLIRAQGQLS